MRGFRCRCRGLIGRSRPVRQLDLGEEGPTRPRSRRRRPTKWCALAVLAVMVSVSWAKPMASAASPGASVSGAPPEVRGQGNAWPLPDHDYNNSRDAGVSSIRASTVSRLTTAWSVHMSVGASTSPIVVGGMAYVQDQAGTVYAIDVSSGEVQWKTNHSASASGPGACLSGGGDSSHPLRTAWRPSGCQTGRHSGRGRLRRHRVRASICRRSPTGEGSTSPACR